MEKKLHGLFPILLTPFTESMNVDFDSLAKLVEYYHKSHVDGLTCLGEVSEVDLLNEEEKRSILQKVLEAVNGEMPVIAGAGRGSIKPTSAAVKEAFNLGASAVMVPPPKVPAMKGEEIYDYYVQLDDVSKGSIIILDNPSLGYPLISVETVTRLVNDSRNIKGIKVEDQPSILKIVALRKSLGESIEIYGASHGRSLFWEMERGIDGVITSAPVPSHMLKIWKLFHEGEREKAYEAFLASLPMAYFMQERPVAVKKEILRHLGVFPNNLVRKRADILDDLTAMDLDRLVDWTIKRFRDLP
ncbi:MAG: dihydrodipicolinate synthase family protein [Thermoplasmata archaeon]